MPDLAMTWLWPILFGLMGFIEPCAIGMTLLFVFTLEGKPAAQKVAQVAVFTLTRTVATGLLGVAAAMVGSLFLEAQKAVWILVGILYLWIGALYASGRISVLKQSIGTRMAALSAARGSAILGALFALNIPACAGPLLLALLAAAAAGGASGGTLANGFIMLGLFGFALSLPIVAAAMFPRARAIFDWLGRLATRLPLWTGALFMILGAWSIWFGLFVTIA